MVFLRSLRVLDHENYIVVVNLFFKIAVTVKKSQFPVKFPQKSGTRDKEKQIALSSFTCTCKFNDP